MSGPTDFVFLNERHDLGVVGWDDPAIEKLWRYNLHYFDDLNAERATEREGWHRQLIDCWISENPIGSGSGWEPYPVSLRIVNWVKWALSDGELTERALDSLAVHARWLSRRLEYHLLGNHLFSNAKALLFAGLFFEGAEAEGWISTALEILNSEMSEQILPDGGHFERSTMYHALAVEDVLDLVNVATTFGEPGRLSSAVAGWRATIPSMLAWLGAMSHPDGEIAFFNDSAIGIAPSPQELYGYANRLGFDIIEPAQGTTHLAESGYVRVARQDMVAILDVAPIGPDYLPGHAHADTLSFELSLGGKRVFVNSGTSLYGVGPERLRQRGSAAHNTVVVGNGSSSEVWAGFRVARRARPFDLKLNNAPLEISVSCSHDGYRRIGGGPLHTRKWRFAQGQLMIEDILSGPSRKAEARYHLHPGLDVKMGEDYRSGSILRQGEPLLEFIIVGGEARIEDTTYHPAFGVTLANNCLIVGFEAKRILIDLRLPGMKP